jgi:hypothetical protein
MSLRHRIGQCFCDYHKGAETMIANKKYSLCNSANKKRLDALRPDRPRFPKYKNNKLAKKRIPTKRQPSGELVLFQKLSTTRSPICEVCGKYINELKVHNWAHILSKGSYPKLRLNEENIAVLCWDYGQGCHEKFDTKAHSDLEKLPLWKKIFEQKDFLKRKYYGA